MLDLTPVSRPLVCAQCSTEVSEFALACPSCSALIYRERLEGLAARASSAASAGDRATAQALWAEARALVPPHSQQYHVIGQHLAALADQTPGSPSPGTRRANADGSWWSRGAAVAVTIGVLVIGKLKFLMLGLTKL